MRLAQEAWRIQHTDSQQSFAFAQAALERARATADRYAECWARLARGHHFMRYHSPADGERELAIAKEGFAHAATADRRGYLLAAVGIARCWWMQGRFRESLDLVLPLRDEGLQHLQQDERGMLLNGIAGCYSALGDSAQAFAYMYQALRECKPQRSLGFDVVLYCNLAHELYQLGDYDQALSYLHEGLERAGALNNARLTSVLLTNRVVCFTDLGRPREALPDIERVLALPADATGRGASGAAFELMAVAALRAGEVDLGRMLVRRARESALDEGMPDARVDLAIAEAELLMHEGKVQQAAERLEAELPAERIGLSLRARCLLLQSLADMHERLSRTEQALQYLRQWQPLHLERSRLASLARYQAASLATELLRLQRERDHIDQRRRMTERARDELESINLQLTQKILEVQSLQAELKQRVVRDVLTGLYNRRHLNETLPAMLALAVRDRQPLSVVVIDLDHFKAVNDVHGHLAGDTVLKAFGEMLRRRLRKSDVACRYGGEEFCLLMPRTDARGARRKVEAMLKEWRTYEFEFDSGTLAQPSFSAGVVDTVIAPGTMDQLLQAADRCAMRGKQQGRARVVTPEAGVTVV